MAEQNLSVDIKIKADTSGAKEATKAIDGLTDAIEEQAVAEKELVQETEKVVVEEKKLVEVEKEAEKAVEKTTAAKKKKVVEQKKETAAIEEAVVVEKKAIDTTGMYIDAKGRVHEAGGKFVKVAKEEREGLKEQIKLQENSTVTTNGASQAKEKLAKSSNNGAMGLLALSNAVQDVQYGFGGMVNNIPQIITGLGMGMGVAGAVQIAAVGIQFLLKNVDLFGEKAKEAARDAADLTAEMMADANAAYKNAEATKAATESQERHNDAMRAAEDRYKEQIRLSEDLLKQKQAERDAVVAMTDAQAGLDMAKIQLAEGRGEMSKEDAIIAREKVRSEADARKWAADVALEGAKMAELSRRAAAEVELGNSQRQQAEQLKAEGAGMMTKDDRELADKNMGSARSQLESSRLRQEELAKTITEEERWVKSTLVDFQGFDKQEVQKRLYDNRQKLAKETEEAAKLQADINREDQKLKKDKEAQLKTGLKGGDAKDLEKAIEAKTEQGKAAYGRAGEIESEREGMLKSYYQQEEVFKVRQQTGATQAQVQVEAEQRRKQEEARREEERVAKDAERAAADRSREVGQVGAAGGSLATTLAGDGLAPGFTDALRTASGGAGDAAGLDRLIAMVAKLAANSSKLSEQAKSKLDKLEAEIEDLRTAK